MMTTLLSTDDITCALRLRDLSDPAQGQHAMQALLDDVVRALIDVWGCAVDVQRRSPLVSASPATPVIRTTSPRR
jgi:phenylalanyl-tRNA synthetase alpha chain